MVRCPPINMVPAEPTWKKFEVSLATKRRPSVSVELTRDWAAKKARALPRAWEPARPDELGHKCSCARAFRSEVLRERMSAAPPEAESESAGADSFHKMLILGTVLALLTCCYNITQSAHHLHAVFSLSTRRGKSRKRLPWGFQPSPCSLVSLTQ